METDNLKKEQAKIWISVPEDHTWTIVSLSAAGIMVLLGILFLGGYLLCIAATVLMILTAASVHFGFQRRILLSKLIYYYDQGELFLISLNKADQKLYSYLYGKLAAEEWPDSTESPTDFLLALTDRSSVIWHITNITQIEEKKAQPGDKRYEVNMIFELLPYPYKSVLCFWIYSRRFDNFEGLMQIIQDVHAKTKL